MFIFRDPEDSSIGCIHNLDYRPLSAIRDYLFNILAAILHVYAAQNYVHTNTSRVKKKKTELLL